MYYMYIYIYIYERLQRPPPLVRGWRQLGPLAVETSRKAIALYEEELASGQIKMSQGQNTGRSSEDEQTSPSLIFI